jgi:hypothetical protein
MDTTFRLYIHVNTTPFTPEPYSETARLLRQIATRREG